MKRTAILVVSVSLALIFGPAFLPQTAMNLRGLGMESAAFAYSAGGGGGPSDFTVSAANADVTYEYAACYGGIISCKDSLSDSDSLEAKANIIPNVTSNDIYNDVTNNGLSLAFFEDTCGDLTKLYDKGGVKAALQYGNVIYDEIIPGDAIKVTSNKIWNIYHFEGQVPRFELPDKTVPRVPIYDRLEMQLKISTDGTKQSTLNVQANTNFCWSDNVNDGLTELQFPSPIAMVFDISSFSESDASEDTDVACIDLTPQYNETDVSSICPGSGLSK